MVLICSESSGHLGMSLSLCSPSKEGVPSLESSLHQPLWVMDESIGNLSSLSLGVGSMRRET